jgi:hypothetical protein
LEAFSLQSCWVRWESIGQARAVASGLGNSRVERGKVDWKTQVSMEPTIRSGGDMLADRSVGACSAGPVENLIQTGWAFIHRFGTLCVTYIQ